MDWSQVVQDLVRQPELFDREQAPHLTADDAELVRTSRGFRYSGKISSRDEGRCLLIAALVMSGRMSLRKISETVKADHRTVAAVMRHLEDSGLLPTVETRVRRLLQETEEQVLLWIDELVASRVVDRDTAATLRSLWTGAGIAADKRMAADGLGGGGIHVQVGVSINAPGSAQADWERRLAALVAGSPDSQSGVICVESQQLSGPAPSPTSLDTTREEDVAGDRGDLAGGRARVGEESGTQGGGSPAAGAVHRGDASSDKFQPNRAP